MDNERVNNFMVFLFKVFLASSITACVLKFENYHLMWWYLILFARIRLGSGGDD
jgi:hypothetical protein